jgi:hypothetical protein
MNNVRQITRALASTAKPPNGPAAPDLLVIPTPAATADYALASQIGCELSGPINMMREVVQDLTRNHRISRIQMQALADAVESANNIARQSQQIARLAGGRLRQSHERISLDELLNQALLERTPALKAGGAEIQANIKPVEIIVDPGLLSSLIDTALNWTCAREPQRLVVLLDIKNWPEHGMLVIKATPLTQSRQPVDAPDSLNWHLLTHVAQAMGVTLEREIKESGEATLLLEFARTVRKLEGLTAMDVDTAHGDSSFYTGARPLAGTRVLLISNDSLIRGEVDEACRLLGIRMDTAPSVAQGQRYVKLDLPHLIIIDERLRDDAFDQMQQEIKGMDPSFGFLEITDDANTFEISSWMSDSMTRVSREVLRAQLPSVLTLELARVL